MTGSASIFALGVAAALGALAIQDGLRASASADRAARPSGLQIRSPLLRAMEGTKSTLIGLAVFSGVSNILILTGSFYMLEVYDRVLPSRSLPTLVVLSLLAAGLFIAQGAIDLIRARVLARLAALLSERLSDHIFSTMVAAPLRAATHGDGQQPVRDLDTVRSFVSGLGLVALFDLPWMPLYLAIIYAFHPLLGHAALAGAVLLIALTLLTEALTRLPSRAANTAFVGRARLGEACVRNSEVLAAMGLATRLGARWREAERRYLGRAHAVNDVTAGLGAVSKVVRSLLQSGMLALGAWLVIANEATGGIIIAGSILISRALAPVELAIAHWKSFVAARQSWTRLSSLSSAANGPQPPLKLPRPVKRLAVEGLSVAPPGTTRLVVQDIAFTLAAGQGLGVIGPSASGKSSLVRSLTGVWRPAAGKVCLDGAALDQWSPDALGRDVGYLPQDVELFEGTVGQNIARFDPTARSEDIIEAARAAGVHDLVTALPNGYGTQVGPQGAVLSAGQRQRIALARALYGEPFLVVLDEPNSNLDAEGEAALTGAIRSVRERGGIAIVIAHRPSALVALDTVLALMQGRAVAFGPRERVLGRLTGTGAPSPAPLTVVQDPARRGA